ncbi:sugar phosphate isomerase/epimerase family protein [Micromonospora coxensis]|uniref:sugar phosphate isomerase/epimerase family protein n=1 Tax=Micromonospora coxensis TaxID=356852 RepID=UPI003412E2EB
MRLGLCLAAFGGSGLKTALDHADEFGPVVLDLPTDSSLGLVDPLRCAEDPGYLDEITGLLAGREIGCVSNSRDAQLLLGPHGPHTDPVRAGDAADKRRHATICATGAIRLAQRLGADAVRLLPGCPDFARWLSWWGSDVSWRDNVAECREHLDPIVRAARDAGVTVMIEPHPKQIVYDRASAELLFAENPQWHDVLRLCVDPANLAACGHDPVQAVRSWGNRMAAVHAKDLQRWPGPATPPGAGWSRYGPQPPIRFRALGLGELDWPGIVAALQDEGFDGTVYVEHEDALLPRQQSIRRSVDLLRSVVPAGQPEGRTW